MISGSSWLGYTNSRVSSMIARRLPKTVRCTVHSPQHYSRLRRSLSSANAHDKPAVQVAASPSPRWLSDIKERIGKCIMFGMKPGQIDEAGHILQELARDWRNLLAGSQGFLTGKGRVGLESQAVVWGEQDTMVG